MSDRSALAAAALTRTLVVRSLVVIGLAATALLGPGGCTGDSEPVRAPAGSCVVQGRVGYVGTDGEAVVRLRGVVPEGERRMINVHADPAGRFRAEVPAGDYVISVDVGRNVYYFATDTIVSFNADAADTIRLGPENSPFLAEFPLGALCFQGTLSARLNGARVEVLVHRASAGGYDVWMLSGANETIEGGRLDLTVPGLLPGLYTVELVWTEEGGHSGGRLWLPGVSEYAQADTFRVDADSMRTVAVVLPSAPARLSGRVSGAWLVMGAGVPAVSAVSADGDRLCGPWNVEQDGSFALDLFQPPPVKIEVQQGGIRQWVGGRSFDEATLFAPQAGELIDGIEVVGSGLRLRVIPTDAMRSDQRVWLEFYDPEGPTLKFSASFRLDRQIGIANLWPGDWLVRVSPYSPRGVAWRPQWLDRAATSAEADRLTLPDDGGVLALDLVLEAGGVMRGRGVSATGVALSLTVVVTTADEMISRYYDNFTGPEGQFDVLGLPDGGYRIGIVPPDNYWGGYGGRPPAGTVWYPGTTDWEQAGIIMVTDAAVVEGLLLAAP